MIKVSIDGLNLVQMGLCDALWACNDSDDVRTFINSLPIELRLEALTMQEMILAAVIDGTVCTKEDCLDAQEILAKFC